MEKVERLLTAISQIAKAENDDLRDILKDFPQLEKLIDYIEKYETDLAKLLRKERNGIIKAVRQYLDSGTTDNALVSAMLEMVTSDILEADEFAESVAALSVVFLKEVIDDLTESIMLTIDPDVGFDILSNRTLTWIDEWSEELGKIMKLSSHKALTDTLKKGIEEGWGIEKIVMEIKDLPQFDRKRARATAITEVLTASSVAQHEAYLQSPAVSMKKWKHSGARKNKPRPHHEALDGVEIPVDEYFIINAPSGSYQAKYPRDVSLPASERVYCHCVLGPVVDEAILGLSKEEKEMIKQRKIAELGG